MARSRDTSLSSCVLVFGESDNDQEALRHLMQALRADLPKVEKRRKPLVLVKGRTHADANETIKQIAAVVSAEKARHDVKLVVAHEDCDNVEPAHESLAQQIEHSFAQLGIEAIAAVPAFEIEAWWYLWPEALMQVNRHWRHPNRAGEEVGRLQNAKEYLRRELRPRGGIRTRDYCESDSPKIASIIRERNIIDRQAAISRSFVAFAQKLRSVSL
jgi:hypothetical protein